MKRTSLLITALAAVSLAGCVEREFLIQSDPPGANLRIDFDEKGEMPAEGFVETFEHYGVREVVLSKSGYKTRTLLVRLNRPFYQLVPLDFFFEHLFPFTIHNVQKTDPYPIALEKSAEASGDLGKDAEAFRDEARKRLEEEAKANPHPADAKKPEAGKTPGAGEPLPAPKDEPAPSPKVEPMPVPKAEPATDPKVEPPTPPEDDMEAPEPPIPTQPKTP